MGKGRDRRPPCISPEEEDLRYALASGEINSVEFKAGMKKLQKLGKIYRRPRYKLNKAVGW